MQNCLILVHSKSVSLTLSAVKPLRDARTGVKEDEIVTPCITHGHTQVVYFGDTH